MRHILHKSVLKRESISLTHINILLIRTTLLKQHLTDFTQKLSLFPNLPTQPRTQIVQTSRFHE
jgi:hypothetical protein